MMVFQALSWAFFGAFIALLEIWAMRPAVHWFETLFVGVAAAFLGGFFTHVVHAEGLWVGRGYDLVSLFVAIVAAAIGLGVHYLARHPQERHRLLHRH